jgi:predicted  nucleic acid-binding Zn-ribbon protein
VRTALGRLPAQRQELERHVAEARGRLEQAKLRTGELQRVRRDLEREANALAEEERRFQTQLLSVKKNEEYTALLHEIEGTKGKRSDLETEILVRMEAEEKEQQERPALEKALRDAEGEAGAQGRVLDEEEAAEQEKLGALEARRERHLEKLPRATRARYERVHASRDGRAVVPIVKGACGGCYRAQPPQVLQEARRRDRMLSCEGCGRLIVWPPEDA